MFPNFRQRHVLAVCSHCNAMVDVTRAVPQLCLCPRAKTADMIFVAEGNAWFRWVLTAVDRRFLRSLHIGTE